MLGRALTDDDDDAVVVGRIMNRSFMIDYGACRWREEKILENLVK
jgi:hypothetical protein